MSDQPSPPEPVKPDGDAPMINAINPDDLMGDFKGKPLFQILAVVLVLHGRVSGVFSYGYLKEQIVGDPEATRLMRRDYRQPWVYPEPSAQP